MQREHAQGPGGRLVIGLVIGLVAGCGTGGRAAPARVTVVAAFYPLAEAARQVGGDRVTVTDLTPAGAEPHDLELSPKQVDEILDARLVVVLGHDFQPAVERVAAQRSGRTLVVLDALPIAERGAADPHVWLDPTLMAGIVDHIATALTAVDRRDAARFASRSRAYVSELGTLDAEYRAGLARCRRHEVVTAHAAFGYLAARYGLRQLSIAGLAPDEEPRADRIAELADLVRRDHVQTVFTEDLVSPKIAQTLAREAGVRTEVLSPLEGLTDAQRHRGESYLSVMRANLGKLRDALACG